MRSLTPSDGWLGIVLASVLGVGNAAAADIPSRDPALAMMSPAFHSALRQPVPEVTRPSDGVDMANALVMGMGQAIGTNQLDALRGGDDVDNTVNIDGRVNDNTATNIVSGSNLIQDGAFANASGINTVIQNSGSNVLIQNGMVVTVQFTDPGL